MQRSHYRGEGSHPQGGRVQQAPATGQFGQAAEAPGGRGGNGGRCLRAVPIKVSSPGDLLLPVHLVHDESRLLWIGTEHEQLWRQHLSQLGTSIW